MDSTPTSLPLINTCSSHSQCRFDAMQSALAALKNEADVSVYVIQKAAGFFLANPPT